MARLLIVIVFGVALPTPLHGAEGTEQLRVRFSWGHRAAARGPCFVKIVPEDMEIANARPVDFEPEDSCRDHVWQTKAGGGDVDGVELMLGFRTREIRPIQNVHSIWQALIARSDPDTARRLHRS